MKKTGRVRSDQINRISFSDQFHLVLVRLIMNYIRYIILTSTVFDSAKMKIKLQFLLM